MLLSEPASFITAAELKHKLKKSPSEPDADYQPYADTACSMIHDRMGAISPVEAVQTIEPTSRLVVLEHTPVIEITAVTDDRDGSPIPAFAAPIDGWVLLSKEGLVRHSLRWPPSVTIEYMAGLDPIPANYKMAALDLAAYIWRQSQQNTGGGRPPINQGDQPSPSMSWALPYSVRQMLGLDKRPRRDVWIG